MTNPEIALVSIGVVWASGSIILPISKTANRTRDWILIGKIEGEPISLNHRKLLLTADWLPLHILACSFCFALAIILTIVPFLYAESIFMIYVACFVAAFIPFLSGVIFWRYGVKDYNMLKETLDQEADNEHG